MKGRTINFCLAIILLCNVWIYPAQQSANNQEDYKFILDSYYAYNDTDAYRLVKSGALKRFLNQWTDDSIVNPVWNYDSFTKYEGKDLYYCTFTADNGKCYYMVLCYEDANGGGLGKVQYSETPYYYDLKTNLNKIEDKLRETDLDLASTVALRSQLDENDTNGSHEVIFFTDANSNSFVWYLDTLEIVKYGK